MSYSRDESFPESLCYFGYPLFICIFVLVLVTFLVRETGHENFILFLFVNTLLFIFINVRVTPPHGFSQCEGGI